MNRFVKLLGIVPPKKSRFAEMSHACQNWFLLHPKLAALEPNETGLEMCRQFMHIELNREGGPRFHIMDRLYKRFSNLRRTIETTAMLALLPVPEEEEDVAA